MSSGGYDSINSFKKSCLFVIVNAAEERKVDQL